jgi:hypothetical protein
MSRWYKVGLKVGFSSVALISITLYVHQYEDKSKLNTNKTKNKKQQW